MRSYKSSSTQRPAEWDKTSSPGRIYHNYNVVMTPADGENPAMYHYDVDEYTPSEYIRVQDEEIELLKARAGMLEDCLLEMSETVYA